MTFSFHPEADEEFIDAVAYYEDCEIGLGLDLSREVYAAIQTTGSTDWEPAEQTPDPSLSPAMQEKKRP
jgi:hypothetical protein